MTYPAYLDATERKIIDCLIKDALLAGYEISVSDGVKRSTDYTAICADIAATDETRLTFRRDGERAMAVLLVHGNDGYDVVADHSDTPEMNALLTRATIIANIMMEG